MLSREGENNVDIWQVESFLNRKYVMSISYFRVDLRSPPIPGAICGCDVWDSPKQEMEVSYQVELRLKPGYRHVGLWL